MFLFTDADLTQYTKSELRELYREMLAATNLRHILRFIERLDGVLALRM